MTRLSVVIPAYNAAAVLSKALRSVERQRPPVDEVIVVDDGSEDDTADVAQRFSSYLPIRVLRNERNIGISQTLDKGVRASRGDLILRLDVDDVWRPNHTYFASTCLERMSTATLLAGRAVMVSEDRSEMAVSKEVDDRSVRAALMWDNPLVHSATAFRRDHYERAGGYRDEVVWQDYDLWIRLLRMGQLASWAEPTVEYTVRPNSLSRIDKNMSLQARWYCQREAIRIFWKQHPVAAARCMFTGGLRAAMSNVRCANT